MAASHVVPQIGVEGPAMPFTDGNAEGLGQRKKTRRGLFLNEFRRLL